MTPPRTEPPRKTRGKESERVFECADIAQQAKLCGANDRFLAAIEQKMDVALFPRGDRIEIRGRGGSADLAHEALTRLQAMLATQPEIEQGDVDGVIRLSLGGVPQENVARISIRTQKRTIEPRTPTQAAYMEAMAANELVFGLGPAGTGKTYLAVAHGVSLLLARAVDRIILSRPAVEAGERLGFLPGDMREKVDPYLRPLFDALQDTMIGDQVQRRMESGEIEVAPLAFMRGRTLANSYVILDEAQNTTSMQMKMFLTRLGENARMVVTGDPSQVDLPPGQTSGLTEAVRILKGVKGVGLIEFGQADVVRHPLVARIVKAYDRAALNRQQATKPDGSQPAGHGDAG